MRILRAFVVFGVAAWAGCGLVDGLAGGPGDDRGEETPDGGEAVVDGGDVAVDGGVEQPDAGGPDAGAEHPPPGWDGPARLGEGEVPTSDMPRLAVRSGGRAYVALVAADGSNTSHVYLATREPHGTSFGPLQQVPLPAGRAAAYYPQLAVWGDAKGALAFGATDASTTPREHLYAAPFDDGLAVDPSLLVQVDAADSDHPAMSDGRSLAVDESGRAVLAWGELNVAKVAMTTVFSSWTAPVTLGPAATNVWDTVSVAASQGKAIVAYSGFSGLAGAWATLSAGSWQAGTGAALEPTSSAFVPRAAMAGGKGLVAWRNGSRLASARFAGAYGATQYLDATRMQTGSFDLAVNGVEDGVAVWRAAPEGGGSFYESEEWAAIYERGTWSAPQRISLAGPHRKCWGGQVAIDELGNAVAVWEDFDAGGTFTRIWASFHAAGSGGAGWSAPVAIDEASPGAGLADKPENDRKISVVMEPLGGGATVAWIQHELDGTARVWVNSMR